MATLDKSVTRVIKCNTCALLWWHTTHRHAVRCCQYNLRLRAVSRVAAADMRSILMDRCAVLLEPQTGECSRKSSLSVHLIHRT